jgi:hypothetical protein
VPSAVCTQTAAGLGHAPVYIYMPPYCLQASEVKQIAGRAGRFSSAHPRGYVTCLWGDGMAHLTACLAQRSESIAAACLLPR